MKIVHVLAMEGSWGGVENHTFSLCKNLAKTNEVHLILGQKYRNELSQVENLHYHFIDFSRSRWNPLLLWQLYRCLVAIQPELVHAQGGKASKIIAFISHFFKIPIVATVHGMKSHVRDYQCFDHLICVSQHVAEKFSYRTGVSVIHNGVELAPQQAVADQAITAAERAIAIGRLDPVKGFDRLIQAWQGVDYPLDIIGEGTEREKLEHLITQLGLQDRVKLVGFKQDVADEIRHSSFVIVSSLKEGGPIVVAEALLLHRPVIATDVGMVKEFIPRAYIAENSDIENLKQLIHTTLAQCSQLAHDFEPAYQKAAACLTLQAMCQKTIAVYQQLELNRVSD